MSHVIMPMPLVGLFFRIGFPSYFTDKVKRMKTETVDTGLLEAIFGFFRDSLTFHFDVFFLLYGTLFVIFIYFWAIWRDWGKPSKETFFKNTLRFLQRKKSRREDITKESQIVADFLRSRKKMASQVIPQKKERKTFAKDFLRK